MKRKALKITFFALGMEHVKYAPKNAMPHKLLSIIKECWHTGYISNVEKVTVSKDEYAENRFYELLSWNKSIKKLENGL